MICPHVTYKISCTKLCTGHRSFIQSFPPKKKIAARPLKRRLGGESSSKRLFCKVLVELFEHFLNRNAMNSTSLFKSFAS